MRERLFMSKKELRQQRKVLKARFSLKGCCAVRMAWVERMVDFLLKFNALLIWIAGGN